MIIYSIQNLMWTLYKITESIELFFIEIFTQIIIFVRSDIIFGSVKCCHGNSSQWIIAEKIYLKF